MYISCICVHIFLQGCTFCELLVAYSASRSWFCCWFDWKHITKLRYCLHMSICIHIFAFRHPFVCMCICDKAQILPYTVIKCDFTLVHCRSVWQSVPDWGYMHKHTHTHIHTCVCSCKHCTYGCICACKYFPNHKSSAHLCQTTILHTQAVCCVRAYLQAVRLAITKTKKEKKKTAKSALHSTGAQANQSSPNSRSAGTHSGHSSCFCTVSFTFSKCLFSCFSPYH